MEILNTELCEMPVLIEDYKSYNIKELPKILLGFLIKHKFDELRISIKPQYNATRIMHFYESTELEPVFFYGIEIDFDKKYKELLHTLDTFTSIYMKCHKTSANFVEQYQNYLKQFELSCSECYFYLKDGVYPIDLKHLPKLIDNNKNLPVNNLPNILEITPEQWYLNINEFGIYVLGTCSTYSSKI